MGTLSMSELLKLYGERNSGTNYLSKLIDLNLDIPQLRGVVPGYVAMLQRVIPGSEWLCDLYFAMTGHHNLGWKHTCAKPPISSASPSVHIVTITKNPYSWLLSMHRHPHHSHGASRLDFETFLQTPWKTMGRDNCGRCLASPTDLWNIKNRSYRQLRQANALNITFEELLLAPDQIIDAIGHHCAAARRSGAFINYHASTTEADKDFEYYRSYYQAEQWREQLTDQSISIINGALDRQLMESFGYEVL